MESSKLYLGYAGHCLAKENEAIRGGRKQLIEFKALWGLIEHPTQGLMLFDTGYTKRFYKATSSFPNKIYAKITKVTITPESEVKAQLIAHGIQPEAIKHIFISHFHADHIAGLRDFPNATLHASKDALKQLNSIPKALGFTKGILKELLPENYMERISVIETSVKRNISALGEVYDLFGDGHIIAVPLPGHAAGQMGLLISTKKQTYFLVADACWLKETYKKGTLPHPIVRIFFHSWKDFKNSLTRLRAYHKENPETIIVPTHCSETTDALVHKKIDLDVL
ncbi:MBL fold metallo-hydrolase [Flavivirga eckloniae]|uniref:MBL fold metallo-hydrolase n=1 Tax=Flavivirga eckloniae TaxID=1803846 RepID=A0A2K9PV95_9FLAO|nr:MBL fold metallo-hydrolase [Flavivirga eckloniae]AUP80984.1 MBL fold metallo-hydrolase [Flavivirga eckloniae]